MTGVLPVHGFVLAGGKSSRMGTDKALLEFHGRPMIEIAVETLQSVCSDVSISGNRDDLAAWAPVVHEVRVSEGPAAGVEAALAASEHEWVLMLPVDLPMMSAELLRRWIAVVIARQRARASYLKSAGDWHPAMCLLRRDCLQVFREELDRGDRKLRRIFEQLGEGLLVMDVNDVMAGCEACFMNVNTPEDLATAEANAVRTIV